MALSTLKDIEGIDNEARDGTDQGDLRDNTYAATGTERSTVCKVEYIYASICSGLTIAVAALAIIIEVLVIILRFLNVGLVNIKINIFLIIVSQAIFTANGCSEGLAT